MPSTFRSADPASATWSVGTDRACATNGLTFVLALQGALGITTDGKWGANTSAAVVAQMRSAGLPSEIVNAAQNEAVNHRVGQFLLLGGIYIVMRDVQNDPAQLGQIVVDPNVVPPQWNIAAPGDGNAGISCVQQVPATPDVPQVNVTVPPPGSTAAAGDTGPTIDITGNVPPQPTPSRPPRTTSGVSAGLVIFVVGAVVVTSLMFRKKGRGR